jgi:TetR/AcrR family fatty acid metabolism transcriptional regulator
MASDSKKDKIIQAALKLFSRQGYHKTTVKEIAREAEVAKGTVYWYFESKKELFRGILLAGISKLNERIAGIAASDEEPKEKLDQMVEIFLDFFEDGEEIAKIYQENAIGIDPEFKQELVELRVETVEKMAEVITEGQERGIFKPDINVEEAASLLMGMISVYNPHFSESKLALEEKKQLIEKVFLTGISS